MKSYIDRYRHQIHLKDIGYSGQQKLMQAKVLCIGIGGTGCPIAMYLACAGIGHIGLIDHDNVELSNLHRQTLFDADAIGKSKVYVAKERLLRFNPEANITIYHKRFDHNLAHLIMSYDVIIDGTDNLQTRYQVNQACVQYHKPMLNISVLGRQAQLGFYHLPDKGGCYQCVFEQGIVAKDYITCLESGALGADIATLATMGVSQVIEYLLGKPVALFNCFYRYDACSLKLECFHYSQNLNCLVCQGQSYENSHKTTEMDNSEVDYATALLWQQREPVVWLDIHHATQSYPSDCNVIRLTAKELMRYKFDPLYKTIICCANGIRSQHAVAVLKEQGIQSVYSLKGGINAVKEQKKS